MKTLLITCLIACATLISTASAEDFWQRMDGLYGGYSQFVACSENGTLFCGGNSIYRSTDNGETWKRMISNHEGKIRRFEDIIVSKNRVFVNVSYMVGDVKRGYTLVSKDDGVTWELCNYLASHIKECVLNNGDIIYQYGYSFKRLPKDSDSSVFFANTPSSDMLSFLIETKYGLFVGGFLLWMSNDNGVTWIEKKGFENKYFCMAEENSGRLYLGTNNGIYISDDGGDSWDTHVLENEKIYRLNLDSSGNIFAFTEQYYYFKSTDRGLNWTKYETHKGNLTSICVNKDNKLFACSLYQGIVRSDDNGVTLLDKSKGIENLNCPTVAIAANNSLLAGTDGKGIFLTKDKGNSWINVYGDNVPSEVPIYKIRKSSDGTLFALSNRYVFRSKDNGESWFGYFNITNGHLKNIYPLNSSVLIIGDSSIVIPSNNPLVGEYDIHYDANFVNTFWTNTAILLGVAVTSNGSKQLWRSTDLGFTWEIILTDISSSIENISFAESTNGDIYVNMNTLLMKSTDKGLTFHNVCHYGFIDTPNFMIDKNNVLFFINNYYKRIYYSKTDGMEWDSVVYEGDFISVNDWIIDSEGYHILATDCGVYKSLAPTSVENGEILTFKSTAAFPNPASEKVTITFNNHNELLNTVPVKLAIFNIIGNPVKEVQLSASEFAENSYEWDCRDNSGRKVSAGAYFYIITTDKSEYRGNFIIR